MCRAHSHGLHEFRRRRKGTRAGNRSEPLPFGLRGQIVNVLRGYLTNSSDYTRASISAPTLKQFDQQSRYVVCVRLDAIGKERLAIFNNGRLNEFIDATPQYCGGVAYRPFTELEAARPK